MRKTTNKLTNFEINIWKVVEVRSVVNGLDGDRYRSGSLLYVGPVHRLNTQNIHSNLQTILHTYTLHSAFSTGRKNVTYLLFHDAAGKSENLTSLKHRSFFQSKSPNSVRYQQ
jgi:hypothetical protein